MKDSENHRDMEWYLGQSADTQLSLFRHYIEMMKILAVNLLEKELKEKTGERYDRQKPENGRYTRWGSNPGSIRIGEEKVGIKVPRIYDTETNRTQSPEIYQRLKADLPSQEVMKKVLLGISQKDYEEIVKQGSESFGLSQSSISRAFIEQTAKALEEFENRDLRYFDFLALVIDGKQLAKDAMIIALGITINGDKIPIGLIQSSSENKLAVKGLLDNLLSRNFRYEQGILVIVDGSKALTAAVKEVLGNFSVIQRCQWHKRENVVSYLNEKQQEYFRTRLQMAYDKRDYHSARSELINILNELERLNRSAANSLKEGLEETLTLHRLGFAEMGGSFKTTNTIESVNRLIGKHIGRVRNWKTSYMKMRWMAAALLQVEKKLRKVNYYHKLDLLRTAIKNELKLNHEMVA